MSVRDTLSALQQRRDIGVWFSCLGDRWVVTVQHHRRMLCVGFREGATITEVAVDGVPQASFPLDMFKSWIGILVFEFCAGHIN